MPVDQIKVWNGKEFRIYEPKETNGISARLQVEMKYHTEKYAKYFFSPYETVLFLVAGRVPLLSVDVRDLGQKSSRATLEVVGYRSGNNGRIAIVRAFIDPESKANYVDYYVDVSKNFAPFKVLRYNRGRVIKRTDIELQSLAGGWWPKSWSVQHFGTDEAGRLGVCYRLRVKELKVNDAIAEKEFALEPPAGTIVERGDSLYRAKETGELEAVTRAQLMAEEGSSGSWWMIVVVAGLCAGVLVCLVLGKYIYSRSRYVA